MNFSILIITFYSWAPVVEGDFCKCVSPLRSEFCKHFWVRLQIDGLPIWFHVHFVILSFFPSRIPNVFRHCCLVGAGKLAEDTSFLCLYIHAWLFSVVAVPHHTVHSELDRLSLARQWSRQIITFFPTAGHGDPWLSWSSIFTLSREVNKSIGSGSYKSEMFSSCTFRSVINIVRAGRKKTSLYPCSKQKATKSVSPSRLRVQRPWSCRKMHNWKALCLLHRFWH